MRSDEQIKVIRAATKKACKSKKAALLFLKKAGILKLLPLLILFSCQSAKQFQQSPQFAKACADAFPCRDTIVEVVTVTDTDTLTLPADTLIEIIELPGRIDTIRKVCPPSKVITNTITVTRDIVSVDSAQVVALRQELQAAQSEVTIWAGKAKRRGKAFAIALISIAGLLVAIGLLIRKP